MNVTQSWKIVKDTFILAIESCIPKVKMRYRKTRPLSMNNDIMAKIKKKKQAYKRYLQTCNTTCIIPELEIKHKYVAEQQ